MSIKKPTTEDFINTLLPKTDKEWDEFENLPEEIVSPKFLTESELMIKKWGDNKFLTTLLILLKFLKPFIFLGTSFLVFFFTLNIIDYFFGNIEDITLLFLFLPLFFGTLTIIIFLYSWIYDWIEDYF
tara:strand:+ start:26 stop:409 length:384 start_codon:yes stop_codon:yes gene_type:complete